MSHLCEQIVDATGYLQARGLTQGQLSTLHHFWLKGRQISFSLVYAYFGTSKNLQERNADFAHRLTFVARKHRAGSGQMVTLIEQALSRWPLR